VVTVDIYDMEVFICTLRNTGRAQLQRIDKHRFQCIDTKNYNVLMHR